MIVSNAQWVEDAICAQVDGDLFYPEQGASNAEAKRLCRSCPVREQCLEAGMSEMHGIWGGHTPKERQAMRRERGITLPGGWSWNGQCGTEAGARNHYRRNEKPCEPCLSAQRLAGQIRKQRRGA